MPGTALLRLLPPETAHGLALHLAEHIPWPRLATDHRLKVRLAGMELAHPLGLAAGLDKDAVAHRGFLRLGFSFVEIGTVTPRPQPGNPRPRLFRLPEDGAIINRMGFNSAGVDAAVERLARRDRTAGIVGANIGMNKDAPDALEAFGQGVSRLGPLADYLTVNVSSPNTPGLRALQKAQTLHRLLEGLLARRNALPHRVSLFVKVAPDLDADEIASIAEVVASLALDALIVSNTTVARPPSLRSPHALEAGGLSGRPLLAPADATLRAFARALAGRVPLIGVGGIDGPEAAYARVRSGATALQLYTALVYQGPGLVRRIVRGLPKLLERDGLASIEEAIGRDLAD